MTEILRLQSQSDPEIADDAPLSTYSIHCGHGPGFPPVTVM